MRTTAISAEAYNSDVPANVQFTFSSPHSLKNKMGRALWTVVWIFSFRLSPWFAYGWRNFLLRCFGAKIGPGCKVYASCKIWAPWNLEMGEQSVLGPEVDCYSVDKIRIGAHATVSQYSYLCTASHDISSRERELVTAPIIIGDGAWVCADVFVRQGITVGEGAVAAARAVVVRDVEPWTVVGGNPAKFLKARELKNL